MREKTINYRNFYTPFNSIRQRVLFCFATGIKTQKSSDKKDKFNIHSYIGYDDGLSSIILVYFSTIFKHL
jgi:hypothetical protein